MSPPPPPSSSSPPPLPPPAPPPAPPAPPAPAPSSPGSSTPLKKQKQKNPQIGSSSSTPTSTITGGHGSRGNKPEDPGSTALRLQPLATENFRTTALSALSLPLNSRSVLGLKKAGGKLPVNWPRKIIYLSAPVYSRVLGKEMVVQLFPEAATAPTPTPTCPAKATPTPTATLNSNTSRPSPKSRVSNAVTLGEFEIGPGWQGPCPLVKILPISDPSHPAYPQCGLFAAANLKPGQWILDYLGYVHPSEETDLESDYDFSLDRELGVGLDARWMGNEARFVNDYRGVPERMGVGVPVAGKRGSKKSLNAGLAVKGKGPNVVFAERRVVRTGERRVCILVGKERVKKGEELCVSYGKGFWRERGLEGGNDA